MSDSNTNKKSYAELQNGSDIRGVALPVVPGEDVNLTEEAVSDLARGFLCFLIEKTGKPANELKISIGRDPRLSGEALCAAFISGINGYGVHTYFCKIASTPAMFMSTVFPGYECDGAVMVTASHLPFNRNGLKFFSKDGGLEKADIKRIIEFAENPDLVDIPRQLEKTAKVPDLMTVYAAYLRKLICESLPCEDERPLEGLKIAVDAGNGSAGFYARDVLEPLGADISASQFLDANGNFPNHAPNPENKEAMASIKKAVLDGNCDLGLIFDTDVDRSSAVDETGREISRNGIVAMAAALIADECPGTTVVTDSITSTELTDFLEKKLGLKHLRFKRGYRNVIGKSIELNASGVDSALAIETSGHAAYKENFFLDDGAYLATKIVIKTAQLAKEGKKISSLIADLKEPEESIEIRMPLSSENFAELGNKIITELEKEILESSEFDGTKASLVSPNYEGIRVNFEGAVNGWFLLRKSLHDPIMPLNIESREVGGADKIAAYLKEIFDKIGVKGLDYSKL